MLIGCNQNTGRSQKDFWETGCNVSAGDRVSAGCRHRAERGPLPQTFSSVGELASWHCSDIGGSGRHTLGPFESGGKAVGSSVRGLAGDPVRAGGDIRPS